MLHLTGQLDKHVMVYRKNIATSLLLSEMRYGWQPSILQNWSKDNPDVGNQFGEVIINHSIPIASNEALTKGKQTTPVPVARV